MDICPALQGLVVQRSILSRDRSDRSMLLACGHTAPIDDVEADREVDCEPCDRRRMPTTMTPGRRTPTFSADSVPSALLAAHLTKAWAELVVESGSVSFYDEDPPWQTVAAPGTPVVIVPDRLHHIEPSRDAVFAVQFYDYPAAAGDS